MEWIRARVEYRDADIHTCIDMYVYNTIQYNTIHTQISIYTYMYTPLPTLFSRLIRSTSCRCTRSFRGRVSRCSVPGGAVWVWVWFGSFWIGIGVCGWIGLRRGVFFLSCTTTCANAYTHPKPSSTQNDPLTGDALLPAGVPFHDRQHLPQQAAVLPVDGLLPLWVFWCWCWCWCWVAKGVHVGFI